MSTSPLRHLLLAAALASLLPACESASRRSASAPTPPAVDCELGTIERPIPPLPLVWLNSVGQLSLEATEWIADVFVIVENERITDRAEAECYANLRKAGVIR